MATMDQLNLKLKELENRKAQLLQFVEESNQNEPRFMALNNQRIQILAEAMIAGSQAPDTGALDVEITEAENAIFRDREPAEVAVAALRMIEVKKNEVVAEQHGLIENIRRDAITALNNECEEYLKESEVFVEKVCAAVASIPNISSVSGFSITQNTEPTDSQASINKGPSHTLDAELFSSLASMLRQAGEIAYVQSNHLNDSKNMTAFQSILKRLSHAMIYAVREKNISVPDWTFSGNLSVDQNSAAVLQRLRAAGVHIKIESGGDVAGIGIHGLR